MQRRRPARPAEVLNLGRACTEMLRDFSKRIERIASGKSNKNDVHKFRTGSRRMEAGLTELLQADSRSSPYHNVYKITRKARKRAGDVRDMDVARELVRRIAAPLDYAAKPACAFLEKYLETKRNDALKELKREVGRRRVSTLPEKLRKRLNTEELSRATIKRVLKSCIARAQKLALESESAEDMHRTRLSIKRLRDVARIVEPLIGRTATSIATRAGRLADRLGTTQDLNVLIELVDETKCDSDPPPELAKLRERLTRRQAASHLSSVLVLSDLKAIERLVASMKTRPAGRKEKDSCL